MYIFCQTSVSNSMKTFLKRIVKVPAPQRRASVLIDLSHRGCSLLEEEGSLSQRQRLTDEVSALVEEEQKLEQLIQRCSTDMRCMSELSSNQKYPFVQTARLPHGINQF